jgi:hypothetical protein
MSVRAVCIIFFIHLILVAFVARYVYAYSEASTLWLIFLLLDFPLSWLILIVHPFIDQISDCYFWRTTFALAIFFQTIGTINWLVIYMLVRKIFMIWNNETTEHHGGPR